MVLGKVAILVGSGLIGTVLTSDNDFPFIGDVLYGALKFVVKHGKQENGGSSNSNPHTAYLLSQVGHLREELQLLASSRSVTVVTDACRLGPSTYTMTAVVLGAIGYGYIKWKGWDLSGMMFVTKRALFDACNEVGKNLDEVSDGVSVTRKQLAGRINDVGRALDNCNQNMDHTMEQVTVIHGHINTNKEQIKSINLETQNLNGRLGCLEVKQDFTNAQLLRICECVRSLGYLQKADIRQVSSPSPILPIESASAATMAASLPPLALEWEPFVAKSRSKETSEELQGVVTSCTQLETSSQLSNAASSPSAEPSSSLPSNEASSSAEPSIISTPTSSSSLFGGLKLPGFSFFRKSAG